MKFSKSKSKSMREMKYEKCKKKSFKIDLKLLSLNHFYHALNKFPGKKNAFPSSNFKMHFHGFPWILKMHFQLSKMHCQEFTFEILFYPFKLLTNTRLKN